MPTISPAQFAAMGGTVNKPTSTGNTLYQNFANSLKPANAQIPVASNPVGAIAKDAAQTLVVKPATRIAQAIAAPLVQNKVDTTTDIQNQQTDQLNKVLGLMKAETDPTKKAALSQMAHKLVDQASVNTAEGQQAIKAAGQISDNQDVKVGGTDFDIQGQQGGAAGVKQISGDALKSASYLATPEAVGVTGEAATAGGRILRGAGAGAVIGAAGGAGNELENPDSTAGSVLKAGGEGAATGAAIGGAIPAAVEGFKAGRGAIEDFANKSQTPKPIKFTPEMQAAHDNLTQAQQAFEDAKAKANTATTERMQGVENSKTQVAKIQLMRDQGMTEAQIKTAFAKMAREGVTPEAVKGVSDIQSGVKAGEKNMGVTFGKAPAQIEATDPNLRYNLSQKDLEDLNAVKEDRKFSLPDYLDQEKNPTPTVGGQALDTSKMAPAQRAQIEAATGKMQGETAKSLTPTQTQDLIRQLNKKTYNPLTGEVDQRIVDLTNRVKSGAQSSFGHIVDENGESLWDNAYQNYSRGMQTVDNLKTVLGVNPAKDLADISPNKLLDKINELGKTPEGELQLQQAIDEVKQTSGVDLNKPVKSVQQIADADLKLQEAQKSESQVQKDLEGKVEEAQKNASQTTKSLVKNEIASREEVQARKADIAKAQAEIDKMEKAKLTTSQKIAKLTKSKGLKWADYALRFIVIRELYKALTAKSNP